MWNKFRSNIIWLHSPNHVARFQNYFGVLPTTTSIDEKSLNKNNNNNNNSLIDDFHHRVSEEKVDYDTNVLDECIEEMKHNQNPKDKKSSDEIDYRITSWFWYYFFQFGAALGNEIFYILFFPTWFVRLTKRFENDVRLLFLFRGFGMSTALLHEKFRFFGPFLCTLDKRRKILLEFLDLHHHQFFD